MRSIQSAFFQRMATAGRPVDASGIVRRTDFTCTTAPPLRRVRICSSRFACFSDASAAASSKAASLPSTHQTCSARSRSACSSAIAQGPASRSTTGANATCTG